MADAWIGLHELAAGEIINKIENVGDVIAFERTSQRFRDLARALLTTVSNPTPIMAPASILTSFPQIRQMNNVIVEISANDIGLARTMNNLVSGNFIFDDVEILLLFLRSYLRPDEVQGGMTRRPIDDLNLRLVYAQNNKIALMVIIEREKILLLANHRLWKHRDIELRGAIISYLDTILPVSFTLTHNLSFRHTNLIIRKSTNIRDRIHLVKPRIYQLLLRGEMGLIDPRSPPGPNNPPLRDRLMFFRTSLGSIFFDRTLLAIYIFLRTGRTPYIQDPSIQPVIDEIFLPGNRPETILDIRDYSVVSLNPDFNDFLSIHPPEDADIEYNYDNDYYVVNNTSDIYRDMILDDIIYLSDGRTMLVTNEYKPLDILVPTVFAVN